jgi:eukaryotic-like serine/threonine-protein kinase
LFAGALGPDDGNSSNRALARYHRPVAGAIAGGGDPAKSAAANARAAALVGRTISDRYRIVELMAMGGMGAIYKGEHLLMRKQVAIKVLHPDIEDFPELVARFEREAIAGAHVNHPNVAAASDFGKFDGDSYFLVLEYIEGVTLSDVLEAEGPLEALRAVKLVRQLAAALGAAHQRGIVHRDVKPRNIMICEPSIVETAARRDDDEIVKLIDFGLAKVPVEQLSSIARYPVADGKELTNAGVVMGTVSYMAPETALGMSAVSAKSDFYSLGIIFYEMLTGKHPFDETEPQKIFAAHCSLPIPPVAVRNPDVKVPADLEAILTRLLDKNPDNRHPDAESLIAALDAFKMRVNMSGTLSLRRPLVPKPRPSEDAHGPSSSAAGLYVPRRAPAGGGGSSKMWLIAAGAAVLALVGVVVFLLLRGPGEETKQQATSARPTAQESAKPETSAPAVVASADKSGRPSAVQVSGPAQELRATTSASPPVAAKVLMDILDNKPELLKDPPVQAAAASVTDRLAEAQAPEAETAFEKLATLGQSGLDVLYEVAVMSDTSKGSAKARAILDKPDVFAVASVPLKVSYDLKRASCQKRPFLFSRAAKEGDDRSLAILLSMMPPACEPRVSPCCFMKHGELERAIAEIRARLRP